MRAIGTGVLSSDQLGSYVGPGWVLDAFLFIFLLGLGVQVNGGEDAVADILMMGLFMHLFVLPYTLGVLLIRTLLLVRLRDHHTARVSWPRYMAVTMSLALVWLALISQLHGLVMPAAAAIVGLMIVLALVSPICVLRSMRAG